MKRSLLPVVPLLFAMAAGCNGDIGNIDGDDSRVGEGPEALPLGPVEPETSVVRRLNSREYRHTLRDLFDVDATALQLPRVDANVRGFDTDGSSLRLAAGDAEIYFEAADRIARWVYGNGEAPLLMCEALEGSPLQACIAANVEPFLQRAFRRPVDANVVEQARMLAATDATYAEAVQSVILFALLSPYFVFHYKTPEADAAEGVDGYELADRLSYFLWSSMPDEELMRLAADGSLQDAAVLEAQSVRLLADPRSERFIGEFVGQWLQLDGFDRAAANDEDASLFIDMQEETRRFAQHILAANQPLARLMDSRETVLNERLAAHYGVAWPAGDEEWRVVTMPDHRRGILAQGSMSAARSLSGNSNPFVRGAWTAEQILCLESPAPPSDITPLDDGEGGAPRTVRELVEQHQAEPRCAGCHRNFDYFGLALEEFDRYGVYREVYEFGLPVDASGVLPDGRSFDSLAGLAQLLVEESTFTDCVGENLATYALGRDIHGRHAATILQSVQSLGSEVRLSDVVAAIVTHEEFTGVTP